MNNIIQLLLIFAVIGLAVIVFLLWQRIRTQEQTTDDNSDSLKLDISSPFQFSEVNEDIATRILEAINKMGGVGEDAEDKYQASLNALKPDSSKIIEAISEELKVIPTSRYLDKWSLIQLLAELRDPDSLTLLDNLLSRSMPEEKFENPHARSSLRQVTINLTTAVEAITRIASEGNEKALKLLLKHSTHESLSVRRACVQGYIAYGGQKAQAKLEEVLSKDDHYLLDIQRTNIEEVPQIRIDASEIPLRHTPRVSDAPQVTPPRD